jgi:hypothetical protein
VKIAIQKRDQRALGALVIAVAAYLLVAMVGIPLYETFQGAEGTALEKEGILKKYRQVVGRKGRYSELVAQVQKQTEQAETRIIRAESPSLAAVELQNLVETSAQKLGIPLLQRNVAAPPLSTDPLREITMTVSFEGTPGQLVSFLSELRSAPKAVRVLTMNVNPTQMAHEAPKSGKFSKNIRVAMTLGAWIKSASKQGEQ